MAWQHWVGKGSWGRRACVCMTSNASFSLLKYSLVKQNKQTRGRGRCVTWPGEIRWWMGRKQREWCKQDNFAVKYKHKPMLPDDSIYDYFYLSIKTIRTNVIGNQISLVNKKKFFIDLVPLYVLEMQTQRQRAEVLLCLTAWCIFEVIVFFHDPDESRLCLSVGNSGKWVFCVNWTIIMSLVHHGKCPFQSLSRRRRTPKLLACPSVIQHCCPVTVPASPVTRLVWWDRNCVHFPPLLTPFSLFFLPFPSSSCFSFLFFPSLVFSQALTLLM